MLSLSAPSIGEPRKTSHNATTDTTVMSSGLLFLDFRKVFPGDIIQTTMAV